MFKSIIAFSLMVAAPVQAANAWTISIPNWVTTLSEKVSEKITAFTDQQDRNRQVTCLALGIYYESRGEPLRGQQAVASVIMNRVRSPRYPDTVCDVIFQPSQFTFARWGTLTPRGADWDRALEIANQYIDRPTGDIPHLSFTNSRAIRGLRIGHHVFH